MLSQSPSHLSNSPWPYREAVVLSHAPVERVVHNSVAVNSGHVIFVQVESDRNDVVIRSVVRPDVPDIGLQRRSPLEYRRVGRDLGRDQGLACRERLPNALLEYDRLLSDKERRVSKPQMILLL